MRILGELRQAATENSMITIVNLFDVHTACRPGQLLPAAVRARTLDKF